MALFLLPIEILLMVLHHLPCTELVQCRAVCKLLKHLIDSRPYFKLVIELGAAGCIDNPGSDVTASRKMELVNEHVRAFSCMHWVTRKMLDPFDRSLKHKLVNGMWFRLCDTTQQDVLEAFPADLDAERRESFLVWDALPSRRRTEFVGPQVLKFPAVINEFIVDATQDLVVGIKLFSAVDRLVMCQMFFRSMSSISRDDPEDHPRAIDPSPSFKWWSSPQQYNMTVHLMGSFIGILFSRVPESLAPRSSDVFILYNWVSGAQLAQMESSRSEEYWETFCFAFAGAVLIPSTFSGTINIYTFNDQPNSLKHAITFLLPETQYTPGLRHIGLATHPTPSSGVNADDEPPFVSNSEDTIIVFFLDYFFPSASGNYNTNLNLPQIFAVPVRVFKSAVTIVEKMQERARTANHGSRAIDPSQCDWSCPVTDSTIGYLPCAHKMRYERVSWMPLGKRTPHIHAQSWIKHTRWGLEAMPEASVQCVHGSRYLAMANYNDLPDEEASALILYDFNMKNVRRGTQLLEPNEHPSDMTREDMDEWTEQWGQYFEEDDKRHWAVSPHQIVTTSSVVDIPEVFTSPFTCSLPYRIVESEHVFRWDSAMIDGERIVGLELSGDEIDSVMVLDVLCF